MDARKMAQKQYSFVMFSVYVGYECFRLYFMKEQSRFLSFDLNMVIQAELGHMDRSGINREDARNDGFKIIYFFFFSFCYV